MYAVGLRLVQLANSSVEVGGPGRSEATETDMRSIGYLNRGDDQCGTRRKLLREVGHELGMRLVNGHSSGIGALHRAGPRVRE